MSLQQKNGLHALYSLSHKVSIRESSWEALSKFAMISRPKCLDGKFSSRAEASLAMCTYLYTKPAEDNFVLNPWPNTSVNPRWWWSKRCLLSSYTPPTSTTIVQVSRMAGSLVRFKSEKYMDQRVNRYFEAPAGLTCSGVRLCKAKQVNRKSFIAVKRAVVGSDDL